MEGSSVRATPRGVYRVGVRRARAGRARAVRRAAAGSRASATSSTAPGRRSTSGSSPPARSRSRTSTRTSAARPAARAGPRWTPTQRRDRRRRLAVRRVLVPGQAVRRRRVPDPVHGSGHADVHAQRRRDDPLSRNPLHLPGPGQSDRPAHRMLDRQRQRGDAGAEADRLQLRLCPAAIPLCGRDTPAASTTYTWAGASGPFPPPGTYAGALLRAATAAGVHTVDGQPLIGLEQRAAAHDQRQRRQPSALDPGLLRPRDPDQRDADRQRPGRRRRPDQDRLGLRLPQPQRAAVEDLRAPHQGRLARDGDPHDRPAVHGPGRRRDDQPVRQLDPEDRVARRRPADDGAPARGRATSACRRTAATTASPTARCRSRRSPPNDGPGQHGRAVGHEQQPEWHRLHGQAADLQPRHVERARGRDALHALVSLEQDRVDQPARPRAEPARLLAT